MDFEKVVVVVKDVKFGTERKKTVFTSTRSHISHTGREDTSRCSGQPNPSTDPM